MADSLATTDAPPATDEATCLIFSDDRIGALEIGGLSAYEFDGLRLDERMVWQNLFHPQDTQRIVEVLASARRGQATRYTARSNGNGAIWDTSIRKIPGSENLLAVSRPLSETIGQLGELEPYVNALGLALPGMLWTANALGKLEAVSPQWETSRGRPRETVLGDGWLAVVKPDQREGVANAWQQAVARGSSYDARFQVRIADGSYRWQIVRAEPVRDDDGAVIRWVGINIDIEDERQAAAQQRIFEALALHASDCIVIFGNDRRVQFFNPVTRRLLEMPNSTDSSAYSIMDFFVEDDRARVESEILPELQAAGRWTGDFRCRNFNNGESMPFHFEMFHIYGEHNDILGIAFMMRDMRESQRYEQGFRMLATAGSALLDTLDYRTILRNIARVVVLGFSPCCVIDELDAHGAIRRLAAAHVEPIRETSLQQVAGTSRTLPRSHIIMRAFDEAEPQIQITQHEHDEITFIQGNDALAFDSLISVPITAPDGSVIAVMTAGSSISELGRRLTRDDVYFLQELAHRAASAIQNSQRYERERHIALTLQEAALPRALRRHFGLHVSAEYRPGRTEATIGGDWYDTLALDDGRFLCIVGDVVGNGLRAAVAMSKLRQSMQTAALINPDPNFILDAADQILRLHNENMYATALVAIFDPTTHSTTFASAGHHGPIIFSKNGSASTVECPGMMIGLRTPGAEHYTVTVTHNVSDVIVLFTDGIIEAQRDAELGLQKLQTALARDHVLHSQNTAEALVNEVLRGQRASDDIAVLALRIDSLTTATGLRMAYRDVSLATEARQVFARHLARAASTSSDLLSAELIFGELLGNVSRHAPGPVEIIFAWEDGAAQITMIDTGPGYTLTTAELPTEYSESSRGMFLIQSFAKSVAVERIDGKTATKVTLQDIFEA